MMDADDLLTLYHKVFLHDFPEIALKHQELVIIAYAFRQEMTTQARRCMTPHVTSAVSSRSAVGVGVSPISAQHKLNIKALTPHSVSENKCSSFCSNVCFTLVREIR
jgi:hypothetical protein